MCVCVYSVFISVCLSACMCLKLLTGVCLCLCKGVRVSGCAFHTVISVDVFACTCPYMYMLVLVCVSVCAHFQSNQGTTSRTADKKGLPGKSQLICELVFVLTFSYWPRKKIVFPTKENVNMKWSPVQDRCCVFFHCISSSICTFSFFRASKLCPKVS